MTDKPDPDDRRELLKRYREEEGYSAFGITVGIFFFSVLVLALTGLSLPVTLGGPALVAPFIYLVLRGDI